MNETETSEREGVGERPASIAPHLARLERRLAEAFDQLWGNFVDPEDAFFDADGIRWTGIGGVGIWNGPAGIVFTEQQLAEIRTQCRVLAATNEFAINGHENRISYIVGSGHSYRAVTTGTGAGDSLVEGVQALLDEFVRVNKWHKRQQEIVRRKDRDGECFLRLFAAPDGSTRVRFVEPGQVAAPAQREGDPAAAMGIQTEPDDVETVLGYWIDGRLIPADEIQHRKANVDANVRRGLPLFYPVRKNLRRAEKLLRNMSAVAQIQSSIALIRKHQVATGVALDQFVRDQADVTVTNQATGRTNSLHRYGPGTILDTVAGTDYEFPASGLDAGRYVTVLQAELRAIASRLVMPEFMLSSDASNANYSSTLTAEGPAVKMFERMQNETIEDDLELLRRVLEKAVDAGRLPPAALTAVDIQATAPTLAAHDRLRDAQADAILVKSGAMSPATMAMRHGLDPGQERRQGAAASASARPAATLPADQPLGEWQFDPDEPRDWRGRWVSGGATGGGSAATSRSPTTNATNSDAVVTSMAASDSPPGERRTDSTAAGRSSGPGKTPAAKPDGSPDGSGSSPAADGTYSPEAAKKVFDKEKARGDIAFKYPADGCYARAHLMAKDIKEAGGSPGKVWAFPTDPTDLLHAKTPNDPTGSVDWTYHVAPTLPVKGADGKVNDMVIDPSLFDKPVSVDDWNNAMKPSGGGGISNSKTKLGEAPTLPDGTKAAGSGYVPGADPPDKDKDAAETMNDFKSHEYTPPGATKPKEAGEKETR